MSLFWLVTTSILTTFLSLIGGFILLFGSKKSAKFVQRYGTIFAAAVLLVVVFLDIIPEILEEGDLPIWAMILLVLSGILLCVGISILAGRFHRHGDKHAFHNKKQALAMLIVDSLHTATDGVVLGAAFATGVGTGVLAALATTVHEIPQEIGDFSIMIRSKMSAKTIAKLQIISGLILVPFSIIAFFISSKIEPCLPFLLALIAGFFLYIALGEIYSIIKKIKNRKIKS